MEGHSHCACAGQRPQHTPVLIPPTLPPTPILQVYQQHDRTRRRKWDFSREGCDVGSGISPGVGSVVVTRAEAGRWEGGKGYGRGPGVQSRTGHDAHPTLRSCRTGAVPTLPQRCGNTTNTITDTDTDIISVLAPPTPTLARTITSTDTHSRDCHERPNLGEYYQL